MEILVANGFVPSCEVKRLRRRGDWREIYDRPIRMEPELRPGAVNASVIAGIDELDDSEQE